MTTNEAFEHLTDQRGWYKLCNIDEAVARSLKRNYKAGKISTDKIYTLLTVAGYTNKVEWKTPKPTK